MARRRRMQGPGPVNIGGTGRIRRPRKQAAEDKEAQSCEGRCRTGRLGEEMALEHLLQMGYRLLERNWRCRHKEIDLIMESGDGIHIVEVRTRRAPAAVAPEQTVNREKQKNIEAAAAAYLRMSNRKCQVHFDIVSIVLDRESRALQRTYIPDAFIPMDLYL